MSGCLITEARTIKNLVQLLCAAYEGGTARQLLQFASASVGACWTQPTQDV